MDTSETQRISVFMQADDISDGTPGDDGAVLNYRKEMFNLEIEWQKPPQGSEQEQLSTNLGGAMSLPEYELIMDVQPINSPADTEHGIDKPLDIYLDSGRDSNTPGLPSPLPATRRS